MDCHNPYFNRWFSAISFSNDVIITDDIVTILILIDGFLQYEPITLQDTYDESQSLF